MQQAVKFVSSLLLLTVIICVLGFAQKNKKPDPEKTYPCSLTKEEWNLVVIAISNPDDVTANQKKFIATKIFNQINPQVLADSSAKK